MSVIVAARRTAIAPAGGALAALALHELAAPVIAAGLADAGLAPGRVDELIVGNALGAGGNPARSCALAAGLPEAVAGLSLDRQCLSGLDAILLADALIGAGRAEVVIAGGVESASRRPIRLRTFPDGRPPEAYNQPPFTPWPDRDPDMAEAAAALAQTLQIGRNAQDAWAIESHAKARAAGPAPEILTVAGLGRDTFTRNLTPRTCARAPVLAGDITTANTAVAADGAAFAVLVSDRIAAGLTGPRAALIGGRTLGGQPDLPGLAPVAAARQALQDAGLSPQDLALAEIMEAYAAQAIGCVRGIGLDSARVNVGGGALARGHPIGASGAVNAVRLFHDLQAGGGHGLAAIAAAGGIGTALLLRV